MYELDKSKNKEIIDAEFQITENFSEDSELTRIGKCRLRRKELCNYNIMGLVWVSLMFITSAISIFLNFKLALIGLALTSIFGLILYIGIKFDWCGCDECDNQRSCGKQCED